MGLFQNTCKPEGLLGKIMVTSMNSGHATLAKWGISHLSLEDKDDVLDIGCGGGANVAQFLKLCPDGKVIGVDYSEVSVDKSKKVNAEAIGEGRCSIQCANVRELPFDDCTFNLATAFETIYFWPGLTESFTEVCRVLKDNGRFFICNECGGGNPADQKWEQMIEGMKLYKENEIVDFLKQAGFSNIMEKMRDMLHKGSNWADEHPEYKDKTWDFHFDETADDSISYYFTRCPLYEYSKKYGYMEILPVMCDLDFLTAKLYHAKLYRKYTLAGGGSICDYRYVGDQQLE